MNIVHVDFQGHDLTFREDGWFNATAAAAVFGRVPNDWIRLPDATEYMEALKRKYGEISYLKASRGHGGGTWMHPKLAVPFARWLSVDFAIWCDDKIDRIIRGQGDWKRARHEAASSHKVMAKTLQVARAADGKETMAHHYANESKLVNWAIGGEFAGLDRERLTEEELDRLAATEIENAVMLGARIPYQERKATLGAYRDDGAVRALPVRRRKRRLAGESTPKSEAPKVLEHPGASGETNRLETIQ